MDFAKVGYYKQRHKARVPIDRSAIRAAFGERVDRVRVEVMEDMIVLTDPRDQQYRHRND
jgi:hypothetical protein